MATLIGDVREAMEAGLRGVLEHVLNQKKNLREYWILVHAKFEAENVMASKVVVLSYQPPKMLGTVCYYVNNREGFYRQLWALPADHPILVDLDNPNLEILQSSINMPIIH